MSNFEYVAARTVDEAVEALASCKGEARPLAGGTDLIVQLMEGRRRLDRVVDLGRIPRLKTIEMEGDGTVFLGAAVPCATIYTNDTVKDIYPILTDSTSMIGSVQIQSRASVGGNLCNASPSGDSIPALICLDAVAQIVGPNGEREVSVEQFCTGPGASVLAPGEIVVGLRLRAPAQDEGSAYIRFIPRNEMDIAVAGVGAYVRIDPSTHVVQDARVALAAVAPTPLRVREAEQVLIGKTVSLETLAEAADVAAGAARPISDVRGSADYRRHLVKVLTQRSLVSALGRAGHTVAGLEGGYAVGQ